MELWKEYVIGIEKAKDDKIWIDAEQIMDEGKIRVEYRNLTNRVESGYIANYRLDTQLKGAEIVQGDNYQREPIFDIKIDENSVEDPTGYYTIQCVFSPTNSVGEFDVDKMVDEGTQTVNTFGILKVTPEASHHLTKTIVAVPWGKLEPYGDDEIAVSNLVKTANLTTGDKLHVYDTTAKLFRSWSLDANGAWKSLKTYKIGTNGTEVDVAGAAEVYTVKRGSGVWLERQDTEKPYFLYGQVETTDVSTPITAGTYNKPSHQLVAPTGIVDFDLNDITTGVDANDRIVVPTDGEPKVYNFVDGAWGYTITNGYKKLGSVLLPKLKRVTDDTTIKAGTGFWYISEGGSPTIEWGK